MEKTQSTARFLSVRLGIYLAAVAIAYALASLTATQAVVSRLAAMGVSVGWSERLDMSLRDLAGLAPLFLPMVAFALLVALLGAALVCRYVARWRCGPRWPCVVYFVAGASALVMIHLTLELAFGLTPIAVARTAGGLALQGLAGGIGACAYRYLVRRAASWREPGEPA
jgi:hypothetical protein